jgi:membrane fusion protein (multidrug efflux system)
MFSCGGRSSAATGAIADGSGEANPRFTKAVVTTITAREAEFHYNIHTNGKIRSGDDQLFTCFNGGVVLVSKARTGAYFHPGEMIMQLDTQTISNRLEHARLALFNGEKEYESELLGYEALLKDKSQEQVNLIQKKLRISSGLASAERDEQEAMQDMAKSIIRAPFAGILADVKAREGTLLKPGDELFRLYDPEDLSLEVKVLESDVSGLKIGAPATISPLYDEKISIGCEVSEINPYVDEGGMIMLKLKLVGLPPKATDKLMSIFPGMNCTAVIGVPARRALSIPREALVMRNGEAIVFTVEKGRTKWNYVTPGMENDHEIEILKGLVPGDKVIISNNLQLADDIPVDDSTLTHP